MKRVTFKFAKALNDAGYPQLTTKYRYTSEGRLIFCANLKDVNNTQYDAPFIMEVWLWMIREKNKSIDIIRDCDGTFIAFYGEDNTDCCVSSDPEDAIVKAIEHLVDNDLIR